MEENNNFNINCSICYRYFNDERKIVTLNCGHYFCSACLGNSNFTSFYKCSICRSVNTEYSFKNEKIISLYNFYMCEKIEKTNDLINFCLKCDKIIKFPDFHQKQFPSHEMIDNNEIIKKIGENIEQLNINRIILCNNENESKMLINIKEKIKESLSLTIAEN
jgi:hypothetical protein